MKHHLKKSFLLVSFLIKIACFILILQSCSHPDENIQDVERWTSTDPLSVNHRLRIQKYYKGNLIENPSFEEGKIKFTDSVIKQVKIDGWEIIGNDVQWLNAIDINNAKKSNEVHQGTHSIYIHRKHADETESLGQGVLSDYIKVIPGNYTLSLYLNLKDIKNPKSRLGTKIYDAIDIRILYYDRNKLQIAGEQYSSYYNQRINSGFKGYSFSNFNILDSTGWLHIIGQSQLFPFPDGDLPDGTKFVRIFIGLKGTGSLWADDICYIYNNQNFTLEERLSRFYDSTFTKAQLIIPQPRKVQILESKVYYWPERKNSFPIILLPTFADKQTEYAAKKLEHAIIENLIKIGKIDKQAKPSLIRKSISNGQQNGIIFSLGKTELFNQYKEKLPLDKIQGHDQGYFIYTLNSLEKVVFIFGNSSEGNLYAIQSVIQLFDNQRLLFHNANLIDYPSDNYRSLLLTECDAGAMQSLYSSNTIRFNEIYYPYRADFFEQSDNFNETGIRNNVYFGLKDKIINSGLEKIQSVHNNFSNNPFKSTLLFCPFLSKKFNLEDAMNKFYGVSEIQSANSDSFSILINSLCQQGFHLEIMPQVSDNLELNNIGCNQFNFQELFNNRENINFAWSGYGLQSWKIDEADLMRIKQYYLTDPVFIDFTLYPRSVNMNYFANDSVTPYKLLTACLFEAFDNNVVREVYEKSVKNILVYHCTNVLDNIRLKTASDFYWNRENYNPEFSLYKALIDEFGIEASRKILKFNALYFKTRSELILARNTKNMHRHARRAIILLNELNKIETDLKTSNYNSSVKEVNCIFADLILKLEETKAKLNFTPLFR